ncbi:multidrug transporter [Clostridia bacterium]|nr:multidrug transporter [Clostridia bacterium]
MGDEVAQHYPILMYFTKYLKGIIQNLFSGKFAQTMFSFQVGLGEDIFRFSAHSAPLDILHLIGIVVPQKHMFYFFIILPFVRMYLSGVSFIHFCQFKQFQNRYILLGSLNYVFCGWIFYVLIRHPFFMITFFYLPLLIEGIERIFQKQKPNFFIFSLALSALTGFYFLYMELLFLAVYAFIRIIYSFKGSKWSWSLFLDKVLSLFRWVCLGLALAGFYLVPVILGFLDSDRSDIHKPIQWLYSLPTYLKMFVGMLSGKLVDWNILLMSALSILTLFHFLFTSKKNPDREARFLKSLTLFCLFCFIFPVMSYIFNGFAYVSYRWIFLFVFVINVVFVYHLPHIIHHKKTERYLLFEILILFYLAFVLVDKKFLPQPFLLFGAVILWMSYSCLAIIPRIQRKRKSSNKTNTSKIDILPWILCLCCIILNAAGNMIFTYKENDTVTFYSWEEAKAKFQKPLFSSPQISDYDFYRLDFYREEHLENFSIMDPGYYGLGEYWSIINGNITKWMKETQNNDITTDNRYMNLDQSTIFNAITSVKAMLIWNKEQEVYLPFAYQKQDKPELQGPSWYENPYFLPMGFSYEKAISLSEYEKLSALEKQEMLLDTVAVRDGQENSQLKDLNFNETQMDVEIKMEGMTWDKQKKKLVLHQEKGIMTLTFEGRKNSETYVQMLSLDSEEERLVKYFSKGVLKGSQVLPIQSDWYWDRKDFLVNMGYSQEEKTQIQIEFSGSRAKEFEYGLADIKVFCLPMDQYPEKIQQLKEESIINFQQTSNKVSGDIFLSKEKYVFLSIPYSKGWIAKVNGKTEEILQTNTAFMSLKLPAGGHHIELFYFTPGLKLGFLLSAGSVGMLGLRVILPMLRKRKESTKNQGKNHSKDKDQSE